MLRPTSTIRWISCCGSPQSPASPPGRRHAASRRPGGRAGISNAPRCRGSISARRSTFTVAASISCFPTTRTRSPSRAARSIRPRSEEHTSELQSQSNLVCRLLLEKKKKKIRHLLCHKKKKKKNQQNIQKKK